MTEFFSFFSNIPLDFLDWSYSFLGTIPWYSILFFALFITFLENIFPPSPSDVLLLFIGSLVNTSEQITFLNLSIVSTIGSTLGFLVMYYLGYRFETRIIESNRLKFITPESLQKPTQWFNKYGYFIIIANRFLSGTRAVISFFAGVTKLDFKKTTILSTISAYIWNSILIYLGMIFSNNLEKVKEYISLYGKIVFPILILGIIILIIRYIIAKDTKK